MSNFCYKPVHQSGKSKKTYITHKQWTVTDETAPVYGIVSFSGNYSDGSFSISDINDSNVALEKKTSNDYYRRTIFDSINHLYYTDPENYTTSGDPEYFKQQTRDINRRIYVVSIPSNIFGTRIKEHSVTMSNAETTVYDDGLGNLHDLGFKNTSGVFTQSKDSYHIKFDFNDGWKSQKGNLESGEQFREVSQKLLDISNGPYEPEAINITAGYRPSGLYGLSGSAFINFTGTGSLATGSNSYVRIHNSRDLSANKGAWDEDFTVTAWIKVPPSQSTVHSYSGNFNASVNNSYRAIKQNSYNVITTSRGKETSGTPDGKCPWELQIFNSKSAAKGKLKFIRGMHGNFSNITSSAVNDGNWHHIAIMKSGSTMQMFHNGVLSGSITDPIHNVAIRTYEDIHIGARPYDFKYREFTGGNYFEQMFHGRYRYSKPNFIYPFSGSIDNYRIYKKGLTLLEVQSQYNFSRDTSIIGNVFYNHGMVVITDMSGSYERLMNDYTLKFKGSWPRDVHNYRCIVEDGEFNVTMNPSARTGYSTNGRTLQPFTTGSSFNPYITTIGLYNDNNELLAVSKLAYPVKSPKDIDIIFNVQFDT